MKTYKGRNNKNIINEKTINSAALEVIEGRLSVRRAARKYKLKPTALYTRIVKRRRFESDNPRTKYSTKQNSQQVFTVRQEKQLLEYLVKCEKMHYGLTFVELQQLAYEFAIKIGCQYPKSWNDAKCGGRTWVTGFCNRNNISLKKPEAILFNETNLSEFYGNLQDLLKKYNFTADRIVNFDEMDMTFDEHDLTENNQDHQTVSAEKRNHVIFCGIIIGNGNTIPPIFVFPLLSHKDDFLLDAPQGSLGLTSTADWMTSDLFLEVLKYVQKHTNCTKEKPVLLLCVSHESHISIEAMDYSLENGIIYLSVPPCTSHMLQPLHAIFGPFKAKLKIAFNNWYKNHPEEILPICKIPALTKIAYLESFTNENITTAFSKSGIQPFSKAFSVEDFPFYKELSQDVPNKDFQASTSKMILDATPIPTAQTQSTSLLTDSLGTINITSEDTLSASKTISKMPESVRHSKMIATFIERQKSKKSGIYADSLKNQDLQEYFSNRKEQNRFKEYKNRVIKEQRAKDLEKSKKLSGCSKQVKKKRYRWEIDSDWTSYSSEVTKDSSTDYSEFSDDDNSINNMITPVQSEPENPKVSDSVLIKYEEDIYDDKIEQDTTMNNRVLQESDRNGMESDMPSLPHNSQNDSSILNTSTNPTSMQIRSSESNNDKIKNINGTYLDPSLVNDFLRNHFANQLSHSTNQNGLNLTTLTPEQSFGLLVATELKRIPEPEKTRRKQAIVDILWKPV